MSGLTEAHKKPEFKLLGIAGRMNLPCSVCDFLVELIEVEMLPLLENSALS